MAKPNRKTQDAFYDIFADMDPDEQLIAMRVLEQTHRISKRMARQQPEAVLVAPAQPDFAALRDRVAGEPIQLREPGKGGE